MNKEQLSLKLYEKMEVEQNAFKEELLTLTPEQILLKAHEYIMREDIWALMEDPDILSVERCKALLKSSTPLADVYDQYLRMDCGYMDTLRTACQECADVLIRHQKQLEQGR